MKDADSHLEDGCHVHSTALSDTCCIAACQKTTDTIILGPKARSLTTIPPTLTFPEVAGEPRDWELDTSPGRLTQLRLLLAATPALGRDFGRRCHGSRQLRPRRTGPHHQDNPSVRGISWWIVHACHKLLLKWRAIWCNPGGRLGPAKINPSSGRETNPFLTSVAPHNRSHLVWSHLDCRILSGKPSVGDFGSGSITKTLRSVEAHTGAHEPATRGWAGIEKLYMMMFYHGLPSDVAALPVCSSGFELSGMEMGRPQWRGLTYLATPANFAL